MGSVNPVGGETSAEIPHPEVGRTGRPKGNPTENVTVSLVKHKRDTERHCSGHAVGQRLSTQKAPYRAYSGPDVLVVDPKGIVSAMRWARVPRKPPYLPCGKPVSLVVDPKGIVFAMWWAGVPRKAPYLPCGKPVSLVVGSKGTVPVTRWAKNSRKARDLSGGRPELSRIGRCSASLNVVGEFSSRCKASATGWIDDMENEVAKVLVR